MNWLDDHDPAVAAEVSAVASRMRERLDDVANDVLDAVMEVVPALIGDEGVDALHAASVQENVNSVLHILQHAIPGVAATNAPIEYARRLAQRGVGVSLLVRAYRVGQARFQQRFIAEMLRGRDGDHVEGGAALWMTAVVSRYADSVVEQMIETYEQAREQWLSHRGALLVQRIRRLLREPEIDPGDAQLMLGAYRVDQHHLGAILWCDEPAGGQSELSGLNRCSLRLAEAAGCVEPRLFIPYDESCAWLWLPLGRRGEVQHGRLESAMGAADETISVALGESLPALAGFRRTHRQALLAHDVAVAAQPRLSRLTAFGNVAAISAMCADLEAARAWVAETLGVLAADDERCAVLRETTRIFLETGGSFTATAAQMIVHRNTAQYRIRKAEELRGRPLRKGRLDVELALLACRYLGNAVLQKPLLQEGERPLLAGATVS